jgi:plastocyanin
VLWRFQTGEVGLGGGAGPSASAAASYDVNGRQMLALANNRAVWAFSIGGTRPERPAPPPPPTIREWPPSVEETSAIQLGSMRMFTIAAAEKKIPWANEHDIAPLRVKVKAGTTVTFTNTTSVAHALEARDGSWRTGPIRPGESGSVTVMTPGVYEYVCRDHPWSFAQLIVEAASGR